MQFNHYHLKFNQLQSIISSTSSKISRALGLFLFACVAAASVHAEDIDGSMTYGGKNRTYIVHLPSGYNASQPTPLVFAFHGLYSSASKMRDLTGFNDIADDENFIMVYPDGVNNRWSAPDGNIDDVGFISQLIDNLNSTYNVDDNRVYAAGASNGGMFTYRLAIELTDKIAAVGIVAGYVPSYAPMPAPTPKRALSVVHFHGTTDFIIPYEKAENAADYWIDFDACSSNPVTEILPNFDLLDGTTVDHLTYSGGTDNSEFSLYKVYNGGHTWPGSVNSSLPGVTTKDIDASEIIWNFFKNHTLNAEPANASPTVSLTTPLDGATFTAPATFRIKATATDTDGTITKVDFYNGSELLKSDVTYKYGYEWKNVSAGTYTIYAVATDNNGATSVSESITITVRAAKLASDEIKENAVEVICDNSQNQLIINKPAAVEQFDFIVYNLSGTEVLALHSLSDSKRIISMESLPEGLCVYAVKTSDQQSSSGKFVIFR